ncbi:Ysy6p CYBJADRAFT_168248 [Cyberlindnera jadinii NRRL Y-1542]|uniref:Stress-associated endoplasmic reticulum protein n=1 Tax=Cyberlindnera jadinii (strain ATCC 18201 / CBS 1600 / BCRC 20928 / JCM 3617 / NBRC 0987 / NRRL Y-1542) TaxID=983966 RepID=A0A1E4RZM4_CYBJN|nr:hypothetical protein CYBJADRAFT_168248 [Cyberlindnera jadinii NRRL Y-1542]ODV72703.1 hypothetical protein CYBJADRAFT_168248 [Cyberlindnera jadinii NRRL Y-1542]
MAIQTPKQRLANEKFYKKHEKQMGKPKPKTKKESPVSTGWIILLAFLIGGGAVLEIIRIFF